MFKALKSTLGLSFNKHTSLFKDKPNIYIIKFY